MTIYHFFYTSKKRLRALLALLLFFTLIAGYLLLIRPKTQQIQRLKYKLETSRTTKEKTLSMQGQLAHQTFFASKQALSTFFEQLSISSDITLHDLHFLPDEKNNVACHITFTGTKSEIQNILSRIIARKTLAITNLHISLKKETHAQAQITIVTIKGSNSKAEPTITADNNDSLTGFIQSRKRCWLFKETTNGTLKKITQINKKNQPLIIDFHHAPLKEALTYIAAFFHQNIILSNSIQGELSIHLEKTDWNQSLNTILSTHQLSKRQLPNALYIAPVDELKKAEMEQQKQLIASPIDTEIINLKSTDANAITQLLQSKQYHLLSSEGTIVPDQSTNRLIIREHQKMINPLKILIKKLDEPQRQIAIEARIVSIDQSRSKELGARFDIHPISYGLSPHPKSLNLARPQFSMGLLGTQNNSVIDLELSALASEGSAKIISSPKLITTNQATALIESGEEIPYQEKSGENQTAIRFKKAALTLAVTPQLLSSQKMMLDINIKQNKRSSVEINGVPAIDAREIKTKVTLKTGETIMLGGIFETADSHHIDRIPLISKIPLIGELFKHRHTTQQKRELLIFMTPRMLNTF